MDNYYQYVVEKIDFNKRFFEPIIEEEDIEHKTDLVIHTKDNIKSKGRHLGRFESTGRIGIVPNMDKETVVSDTFKKEQY